jgi:hypothetical protein
MAARAQADPDSAGEWKCFLAFIVWRGQVQETSDDVVKTETYESLEKCLQGKLCFGVCQATTLVSTQRLFGSDEAIHCR